MYSKREEIIWNYIEGYNTFNVTQMLQDIHPEISFSKYPKRNKNLFFTRKE